MQNPQPRGIVAFLTRRRGGKRLDTSDIITYLYLIAGTVVMFGPVLWLVMSSFKPLEGLYEFPPTFLPYQQKTVQIAGYDQPLDLYDVKMPDGTVRRLAQISQVGIGARMIDPNAPNEKPIDVRIEQRTPVRTIHFELTNYTDSVQKFPFLVYLRNSVVVTVLATLITLLINSMAAYALSKYEFRGRDAIFVIILSTLMVPVSVILIPAFLVIAKVGWSNNLWGLIIPGAATPTGVFLLRQYMLTIPDDLLQSARIDGASEWRIYWQIILPLAGPALAVLAIFSVMWRWNDFLWPLIVVSRSDLFTLQVGLNAFQGELNQQWNYILAMTVLTLLPITIVFALLERYITTGIATTGLK
jgi:alpha-1,4-digalacturonate transport system permease protein